MIDKIEWTNFYELFKKKFEKNDLNNDHRLNLNEIKEYWNFYIRSLKDLYEFHTILFDKYSIKKVCNDI